MDHFGLNYLRKLINAHILCMIFLTALFLLVLFCLLFLFSQVLYHTYINLYLPVSINQVFRNQFE